MIFRGIPRESIQGHLFNITGDRMKCNLWLAGWKADCRKGPGGDKLSLCEHCPGARKANHTPGCMSMSLASRLREVHLPLYWAFVKPQQESCAWLWTPWEEEVIYILEWVQQRVTRDMGHVWCVRWLRRLVLLSVEKRKLRWALLDSPAMWWECVGRALPCFSWRSAVRRQEAADTDWSRNKILSRQ